MLSQSVDKNKAIEELEGVRWPDPPPDVTPLVRTVHAMRKQPIKDLRPDDLARLIGQDVGLQWLLPVALDFLRDTAPDENATGWYDDDLLMAVFTRKESVWRSTPELARHLDMTVRMLSDVSSHIKHDVAEFREKFAELL